MEEIINNVETSNPDDEELEFDYLEYIQIVNEKIENLDLIMKDIFINDHFNEIIGELYSEKWNRLTPKGRLKLFSRIHNYVAQVLGEPFLNPNYQCYEYLQFNQLIDIVPDTNVLCIDYSVFKQKNRGVSLLHAYIHKVAIHFVYKMVSILKDYDPSMSVLTQEYYHNTCTSFLYKTWDNYLDPDQEGYSNQPIYVDTAYIADSIMKEYCKFLYKSNGTIDKEISDLLYVIMNDEGNKKEILEKRNIQVQKNLNNLSNDEEDSKNIERFLEKTKLDYTKFTDDEFFELFNVHYKYLLSYDEDGYGEHRMTSLSNELMRRVFRNFDLEDVEFPNYKITIQENGGILLDNGLDREAPIVCENFSEIISNLLVDMCDIAVHYGLFEFDNEQEKEDFFTMKEWYSLKIKEEKEDALTTEIVSDGLNIVNVKVTELYNNLINKINLAINKSDYLPRGESIIRCADKGATYDYYEFKNGKTRYEVTNMLMNRIREDLEKIKNRGGR